MMKKIYYTYLFNKKIERGTFMEENIVFNSEDVSSNKAMGILSYIGILFLIPLFAAKDSQYARFHTNQGLVLFIVEIALNIVVRIISAILGNTMGLLALPVVTVLNLVVGIFSLVFLILGIINACSGEPKKLPLIGSITILK